VRPDLWKVELRESELARTVVDHEADRKRDLGLVRLWIPAVIRTTVRRSLPLIRYFGRNRLYW
jgi:hypothetical protein